MAKVKPRIRYFTINGLRIRTAVWKSRVKMKARPVLFFNGIGANLEMAAPLAEALHDRSDLIAFDVPGVGKSESPKLPYRPCGMASMANEILDHLGVEDVDVIGVSWGGGMAQQFAFQYPKRARNIVLAATTAGSTMVPGTLGALTKMMDPKRYTDPDYLMKNYEALYGETTDKAKGDHAAAMSPPTGKGYFFQLCAMIAWSSIPFLPFLRQRVLILAGKNDKIVPVINSRILHSLIPKSRLEIVDGGHLFIVSKAATIMPMIMDFFDDNETGDRSFRPAAARKAG